MANEGQGIFRAIPLIMAEVGAVEKTRRNAAQNYNFRGIDDLYAALQLILAKHGVFVVPRVLDDHWTERQARSGSATYHVRAKVAHVLYASDGSSVEAITIGEGMDSGDKAANKAMSSAMKYALVEVFCVPSSDPKDPENDSHEITPTPPAPSPAAHSGLSPEAVKRVQAAVTDLNLGHSAAFLTGKAKEEAVRQIRLNWIGEVVKRKVASTKDLTMDEAGLVISTAKRLLSRSQERQAMEARPVPADAGVNK